MLFINQSSYKTFDIIEKYNDIFDIFQKDKDREVFISLCDQNIVHYVMDFDEFVKICKEKSIVVNEDAKILVQTLPSLQVKAQQIVGIHIRKMNFKDFYEKYIYVNNFSDIMDKIKSFDKNNYEHLAYFIISDYIFQEFYTNEINRQYIDKHYKSQYDFIINSNKVIYNQLNKNIDFDAIHRTILKVSNFSMFKSYIKFISSKLNELHDTYEGCTVIEDKSSENFNLKYKKVIKCRLNSSSSCNVNKIIFRECTFDHYCISSCGEIEIDKCNNLNKVFITGEDLKINKYKINKYKINIDSKIVEIDIDKKIIIINNKVYDALVVKKLFKKDYISIDDILYSTVDRPLFVKIDDYGNDHPILFTLLFLLIFSVIIFIIVIFKMYVFKTDNIVIENNNSMEPKLIEEVAV